MLYLPRKDIGKYISFYKKKKEKKEKNEEKRVEKLLLSSLRFWAILKK